MTDMQIFVHNALWRPPTEKQMSEQKIRARTLDLQFAREELGEYVLDRMKHGESYSLSAALPNESTSMSASVMRHLVQTGKVIREIKRGRMYYRLTGS